MFIISYCFLYSIGIPCREPCSQTTVKVTGLSGLSSLKGHTTVTTLEQLVDFVRQQSASEGYVNAKLFETYGYALINYDCQRSAEIACSNIDGKHFYGGTVQAKIKAGAELRRTQSVATVKILCLPSNVNEGELRRLCSRYEKAITSVKVNPGFAYVNFSDLKSAQNAIACLDKTELRGQTLSAKVHAPAGQQDKIKKDPNSVQLYSVGSELKSSFRPVTPVVPTTASYKKIQHVAVPVSPEGTVTSTVKVELDSPGLSGNDLFHYFSQFGVIEGEPSIYSGDPNYAYVNFRNSHDAVKSYQQNKVKLKTVTLTIKPSNKVRQIVPEKDTQRFVSDDRVINQLIATHFLKKIEVKLVPFNVIINPLTCTSPSDGIQITGNQEDVARAMVLLKTEAALIGTKITTQSESFDCNAIPNFSDPKLFQTLQTKYCTDFSVLRNDKSKENIVSFCSAIMAFSKEQHPMKVTLLDDYYNDDYYNDVNVITPVWSFKDDHGMYTEMSDEDSKALENLFQKPLLGSQLTIGSFQYLYDFSHMKQTNLSTLKVRSIRRSDNEDFRYGSHKIVIDCRGLQKHVNESLTALKKAIGQATTTIKVKVPEELQDKLSKIASQYCVAIQKLSSGSLSLTGNVDYVRRVNIELKLAESKMLEASSSVPLTDSAGPHWELQSKDTELKHVIKQTEEWKRIEDQMRATLPNIVISEIHRIQSKWLWNKYAFCRQRMRKKNGDSFVNEKLLCHGSGQIAPDAIYNSEYGFDFRFGRSGMWGKGAYFACNASYSNNYAYGLTSRNRQMFLAYVLTGISVELPSDSSLDKPPLKPSSTRERYDSVKGNTGSSDIYIVYDHDKSYPAYIVTYTA